VCLCIKAFGLLAQADRDQACGGLGLNEGRPVQLFDGGLHMIWIITL